MKLYPYQTEAVSAVLMAWERLRAPAVVLPTGMGKTVIFTELSASLEAPAVIVHREELAHQAMGKLRTTGRTVGLVKADRDERHADIVVASIQTLARTNRLATFAPDRFSHIIIDEAHHAAADSYRTVTEYFNTAKLAGFTATMDRGDSRALGAVWDEVVYTKDILYGIMGGYLCDVRGKQVPIVGLDLKDVPVSGGDYQDGALGNALTHADAFRQTARAYAEHAQTDDGAIRPGILFGPTVATAAQFADALNDIGITAEVVIGETSTEDRAAIYHRFANGQTKVLCSCMVLTEGFDAPHAEVCVIARPTRMAHLYTQMVGRVLRTFPGKREALVLDVVGITTDVKIANLAVLAPPAPDGELIEVRPDETLNDAVIRTQDAVKYLKGEIGHAKDIELFDRSMSAWLRTPGGTWFVPTRAGLLFLQQSERDGTYMVGKTASQYRKRGASMHQRDTETSHQVQPEEWGWLASSLPLDYAMAYAEDVAQDLDPSVASKKSSWRQRSKKISESQQGLMIKNGIPFDADMSRNEAGNLISTFFATKLFDRR